MRARGIKPGFFTNEVLGQLDPMIRLTFIGLWCLADKEGILEDRPLRIKAELFPYGDSTDVNGYLTVLQRHGFIVRYVVDGKGYVQVLNFEKHQHPHHTERPRGFPKPQCSSGKEVLTPLCNGYTPSDLLTPDLLTTDSLTPDLPTTDPLTTDCCKPRKKTRDLRPAKAVDDVETALQAACRSTWAAYSSAYQDRYGVPPLRSAKSNAAIKRFCQQVPADEAPAVAAHYLLNNSQWYVNRGHTLDSMAADAAKLRTEWATGARMTATRARQIDKTGTMLSIVEEIERERGLT